MRVHLVDGTFELFRAHFAKRPPHTSPEGLDRKATVGVVQSMLWLLSESKEAVTHIAVAFDNPIISFRNRLFAGYKTDEGIAPELRTQFDPVEEAVSALGVKVWSMSEFEADDALAAGAAQYSKDPRVTQVRILTPDKDLGQCLVEGQVVQVDRIRDRELTCETLRATRGITPALVPDFLALVGDDADGIPGVPGWGEKSAAAVLMGTGSLEAIGPQPSSWPVQPRGADRLAASLNEHREAALLYKRLATLRVDAPIEASLDALEYRGVPRAEFTAWCQRLGAQNLLERVTRWA